MQLVAYGAQDTYLTADPSITFWKAVYKRHTNFAMESMSQTLSGTANFGNRVVCRISRNGDLLHRVYVNATLPAQTSDTDSNNWVNRVGFCLLNYVELRVGGQVIDRQYSRWMHIWTELTHDTDMKALLDKLVGPKGVDGAATTSAAVLTLQIPLMFSFCRNPGLALPLIALQYHEVELNIQFETLANCLDSGSGNGSLSEVEVWADYIFLDTEERKEFAQRSHEYLIEVTQNQEATVSGTNNNSVRLTFNHPTKFVCWAIQTASVGDKFTCFTNDAAVPVSNVTQATIKLNGQERMRTRNSAYFNYVQAYQHFGVKPDLGINVYSFAVRPAEHQPSGSCNMSRIDNINLEITPAIATSSTLYVYSFAYNVFRVASGMGGLAYST